MSTTWMRQQRSLGRGRAMQLWLGTSKIPLLTLIYTCSLHCKTQLVSLAVAGFWLRVDDWYTHELLRTIVSSQSTSATVVSDTPTGMQDSSGTAGQKDAQKLSCHSRSFVVRRSEGDAAVDSIASVCLPGKWCRWNLACQSVCLRWWYALAASLMLSSLWLLAMLFRSPSPRRAEFARQKRWLYV